MEALKDIVLSTLDGGQLILAYSVKNFGLLGTTLLLKKHINAAAKMFSSISV